MRGVILVLYLEILNYVKLILIGQFIGVVKCIINSSKPYKIAINNYIH